MDRTNIFFHHLGILRIEEGNFKLVKSINITTLEEQIEKVRKEIYDFADHCVMSKCTWNKQRSSLYLAESERLEHDLNSIFSLLGKHRISRSIDFIGTGLKHLFGTMDNDDREYVTGVLQNLGDRQDKLHSTMGNTVRLMSNMTKQWELLKENQRNQMDNFLSLKDMVVNHYQLQEQMEWEFDFRTFENHLDSLILSVQVQIDKLRNAVLFLKAGVVDPYFVDPDELMNALTFEMIHYHITVRDVDAIMSNSNLLAVFNSTSQTIHIIFRVPMARDTQFKLYENLIIPKQIGSEVVVLDNVPKYLVVSFDNTKYFTLDNLSCFTIFDVFICKKSVLINVGLLRECLTDLYFQNVDSNCEYRKLRQKLEIHNVLNSGLILFSTKGLQVQLNCPNGTESVNLTGSHLLQPPIDCSVNSSMFEFDRTEQKEFHLTNRVPIITCCSAYFSSVAHLHRSINNTLVFKSLHEIRKLESPNLGNSLSDWTKFDVVNFKDQVKPWHISLIILVPVLIVSLILWFKFQSMCSSSTPPTVIHFTALHDRSDMGNPFA